MFRRAIQGPLTRLSPMLGANGGDHLPREAPSTVCCCWASCSLRSASDPLSRSDSTQGPDSWPASSSQRTCTLFSFSRKLATQSSLGARDKTSHSVAPLRPCRYRYSYNWLKPWRICANSLSSVMLFASKIAGPQGGLRTSHIADASGPR